MEKRYYVRGIRVGLSRKNEDCTIGLGIEHIEGASRVLKKRLLGCKAWQRLKVLGVEWKEYALRSHKPVGIEKLRTHRH